jgi:hypothetical protein
MRNLYATAARGLALTSSMTTALLVLFASKSLASMASIDGMVVDALNYGVLALCALGFADLVWRDIHGKMIWPSFNSHIRHHICVLVYAGLAGAYGLRLFSWADPATPTNAILGVYYLLQSLFIGTIAVAIALEPRHDEQV